MEMSLQRECLVFVYIAIKIEIYCFEHKFKKFLT